MYRQRDPQSYNLYSKDAFVKNYIIMFNFDLVIVYSLLYLFIFFSLKYGI